MNYNKKWPYGHMMGKASLKQKKLMIKWGIPFTVRTTKNEAHELIYKHIRDKRKVDMAK
jgi:hypothetical protein